MPSPRALLLAAAVSIAGCTDATFEPTLQPSDVQLSRYDAVQYEVRDLGTFDGLPTVGFDMDKHGTVFGRYGSGLSQRSFRWTEAGGYEDLGELDGAPFQFLTANDHGLLNGSIFTPAGQRATAWVPQTGFVLIDPGFFGNSLGNNDRGVVAGVRFTSPGIQQAFVWSEKDGLDLLPVMVDDAVILRSAASDVNDFGSVTGVVSFTQGGTLQSRAFVWDDATGTTLIPPLGPGNVGVTYISDGGLVVGASQTRRPMPGEIPTNPIASRPGTIPVQAWKWSAAGGLVALATLGGDHSVAWKADREGNVYGWASDADGVQHAVKWPAAGGIIDLGGLGGLALTGGLNKHGVVVGWSEGADGVAHAVVFTPLKK